MGLSIAILVGEIATEVKTRDANGKPVAGFLLDDGKTKHRVSVFEPPEGLVQGATIAVQGTLNNRNAAPKDKPAQWVTEVIASGTKVTVVGAGKEDDGLAF